MRLNILLKDFWLMLKGDHNLMLVFLASIIVSAFIFFALLLSGESLPSSLLEGVLSLIPVSIALCAFFMNQKDGQGK